MSYPPPPEPGDPIAELRLAALPDAAPAARRFAAHQLRLWGLDGLVYDVEILVSELTTNSIRATGSTTTPTSYTQLYDQHVTTILLRLRITKGGLYFELWDASSDPPIPVTATAHDERGRGLLLVETLSEHWSWHPSWIGGKITWCRVKTSTPPVDTLRSSEPVADWPPVTTIYGILADHHDEPTRSKVASPTEAYALVANEVAQ